MLDVLRICGVASCLVLLGLNLALLRNVATGGPVRLVILGGSLLAAYVALDLWYDVAGWRIVVAMAGVTVTEAGLVLLIRRP